jgi:hypothetical protein
VNDIDALSHKRFKVTISVAVIVDDGLKKSHPANISPIYYSSQLVQTQVNIIGIRNETGFEEVNFFIQILCVLSVLGG